VLRDKYLQLENGRSSTLKRMKVNYAHLHHEYIASIITHANDSRAISHSYASFVCPHDRTNTAESTVIKLATGIVHHESWTPGYSFNTY